MENRKREEKIKRDPLAAVARMQNAAVVLKALTEELDLADAEARTRPMTSDDFQRDVKFKMGGAARVRSMAERLRKMLGEEDEVMPGVPDFGDEED